MEERKQKEFVLEIFDSYDHDHDGSLTFNNVKEMLSDFARRKGRKFTLGKLRHEASALMIEANSNFNGRIEREEFYEFFMNRIN